jgi:hypothetical protein
VTATQTIRAIAIATGWTTSSVATQAYIITTTTPAISPNAGFYTSAQSVTITDATPGAVIYYTTNSSPATTSSTKYAAPIKVTATATIRAVAIASGLVQSPEATALYSMNVPTATPTFSPVPGSYSGTQSVTLTDATAGATIYYTTDGSTPTTISAKYTGVIAVSATKTIKAIATAPGHVTSALATGIYTILPATKPKFVANGEVP